MLTIDQFPPAKQNKARCLSLIVLSWILREVEAQDGDQNIDGSTFVFGCLFGKGMEPEMTASGIELLASFGLLTLDMDTGAITVLDKATNLTIDGYDSVHDACAHLNELVAEASKTGAQPDIDGFPFPF